MSNISAFSSKQQEKRHAAQEHHSRLDVRDLSRWVNTLTEKVETAGLNLTFHEGVTGLHAAAAEAGRTTSPLFGKSAGILTPEQVIWAQARDETGQIVHLQASRRDMTGDGSLADLLPNLFDACWSTTEQVSRCSDLCRVKGTLVYRGEFWVRASPGRFKVSEPLALLGLAQIFTHWNEVPDWIWAVFERKQAESGFATRAWYKDIQPLGQDWEDWLAADEFVGFLSYKDFVRRVTLAGQSHAR